MVVVVVRGLHHREVDVGAVNLQPALDVVVLQIEWVELRQIIIGIPLDVGGVDLTVLHILLGFFHLALQACDVLLRFFVLCAKIHQIGNRADEDTQADPQQNLPYLIKFAVVPVWEDAIKNSLDTFGRFRRRLVLLRLLLWLCLFAFFAMSCCRLALRHLHRCRLGMGNDIHSLQHRLLGITAALRRLRVAFQHLACQIKQSRDCVRCHLGQRMVGSSIQFLHHAHSVQHSGDVRLPAFKGGVGQADAQAQQLLFLLLGSSQRQRSGNVCADRSKGLSDLLIDSQFFQIHLLRAAGIGGKYQLALAVCIGKAFGCKTGGTGLGKRQADIFLCAPYRYRVLDAVDVDSVDAAAQPLLHCLECGVAVLCCLLAVLGVITDAHDDLRTLSVYCHTRVLRCQQVLQCSFHLSGV